MSSRVVETDSEQLTPAPWRVVDGVIQKERRTGGDRRASGSIAQPEEITARLEEARQRGFGEGVAAARAKAEAEVAGTLERLSGGIGQLVKMRDQIREEATTDLVRMAILIASRILHRELSVDPDAILGLVRAAMEKAGSREIHRVKLHPSHEAQVRKALGHLSTQQTIEIVADPSLKP